MHGRAHARDDLLQRIAQDGGKGEHVVIDEGLEQLGTPELLLLALADELAEHANVLEVAAKPINELCGRVAKDKVDAHAGWHAP
jgi:hypothetical protein